MPPFPVDRNLPFHDLGIHASKWTPERDDVGTWSATRHTSSFTALDLPGPPHVASR